MRIVIALGGNALLRRGEPQTSERQAKNVRLAAEALSPIVSGDHEVVITHGNGPQVGLLSLQGEAYSGGSAFPLDVLGAETEGMIGYLLERALQNACGHDLEVATLLTQVVVDARDRAFLNPTKPVGPVYSETEARAMAATRGWAVARDGRSWRRVVPSPAPKRILELSVIRRLVASGVTVICAGGGGIPVVTKPSGTLVGVEAVIDKDRASALLADALDADALLLLTDVDAVYRDWNTASASAIRHLTPDCRDEIALPAGSMGPKVEAACQFVKGDSRFAAIGALADAVRLLNGKCGTRITAKASV